MYQKVLLAELLSCNVRLGSFVEVRLGSGHSDCLEASIIVRRPSILFRLVSNKEC
jgi:hypothetical protein